MAIEFPFSHIHHGNFLYQMPDASGQSIPASLLRSTKIPKRKASAEPPQELEEGEMVSPSPSPRATPVVPKIESPSSTPLARSSDSRSRHGHRSSRSRSRSPSPSRSARKRRDEDGYSDSSKRRRHRRDSDDEHRSRQDTSRSRTRRSRSPSPKRSRSARERDTSRDRDRRRHDRHERDSSKARKDTRRSSTTDRPSPRPESKHTHDDHHSSSGSSNGGSKRRTSTTGTPVRGETARPDTVSRRRPSAGSTASTPSSTGDAASRLLSTATTATSTTPAANASDTRTPPSPVSDLKNATDPQAESPEQVRAFAVMFKQLATAYKRRADRGGETVVAAIDQVLALLNYVLSFHYQDKQSQSGLQHWESLFPFLSVVLRRLKGRQDMVSLHGLCVRMSALVRFYIFSRREPHTRKVASGATDDTAKEATTHAVRTLQDYEMAYSALRESDRILSYDGIRQTFPKTFEAICVRGDLRPGITLGGEAGVSTEPMFPLSPFSRLHHAAIMVKACVHEYLKANNVSYSFITDYAEFM